MPRAGFLGWAPLLALVACAGGRASPAPPSPPTASAKARPAPRRPGSPPGEAELRAAIEAAKADDLGTTVARCRAAIRQNPQLEQAYLLLGSACSLQGDAACEEAAYREGIEALPRSSALLAELGFLKLSAGDAVEAETLYARAHALAGDEDPSLAAHLAYARGLNGKMEEALSLAGEAAAKAPRCLACATIHGKLLLASRPAEAVAELERARSLDASDIDAAHQLAKAYFLADRADEAAGLYAELVTAAPEDPALRSEYAVVLRRLKRHEKAVEQLSALDALVPGNRAILERLHEAQIAAGDRTGAAKTQKQLDALP